MPLSFRSRLRSDCRLRAGAAAALAVLVGLGPIGCAVPNQAAKNHPAILRVPLPREINTLDPRDGDDINTHNIIRQLYEGLVDYDPRTLAVVPRIAAGWRVSPDALAWTFDLREGVRFIDDPCFLDGKGREITAEDAKLSIERGLAPFRGASTPAGLPALAGLPEYLSLRSDGIAGIEATSSTQLTIRLSRPDSTLLHFLAQSRCFVVAREAIAAYGDDLRIRSVGTGPFRLVAWAPLSGILLVRSRAYWGKDGDGHGLPYIDAIRFLPQAGIDMYRRFADGDLDVLLAGGEPQLGGPEARSGRETARRGLELLRTFDVPRLNTIYTRFDYRSRHPVVRSRLLRLAVSYAISRTCDRSWIPAKGLFPPGLPDYDPALAGQHPDPARGKELLARAGYPAGRGLPVLRLGWREWNRGLGRDVARELESLGLEVELQTYPDTEYSEAMKRGEADLFRAGWMADYPDARNLLGIFVSGAAENIGGYSNAEFDRLFGILGAEQDEATRLALARRMERILIDDVAAIFLMHERVLQYVSPRVADWDPSCTNPLNLCFYERIRLLDESP